MKATLQNPPSQSKHKSFTAEVPKKKNPPICVLQEGPPLRESGSCLRWKVVIPSAPPPSPGVKYFWFMCVQVTRGWRSLHKQALHLQHGFHKCERRSRRPRPLRPSDVTLVFFFFPSSPPCPCPPVLINHLVRSLRHKIAGRKQVMKCFRNLHGREPPADALISGCPRCLFRRVEWRPSFQRAAR